MEFKRFSKRKKPNFKRAIILLLLLALILYLWFNVEGLITGFFESK